MSYEKPTTIEEALEQINEAIPAELNVHVEICGYWIWLSGDTKPVKDNLKRIGCRWSSNKQQWYWRPPGAGRPWFKGSYEMTMDDIRDKYGNQQVR